MCRPEEDIEKAPLIPRDGNAGKDGNKDHPGTVTTFLGICRLHYKGLLIKLDMASMQSPRTQCCCCAIGVFAAMFGIFMLSAGICIVLNVNYMEVDTSGLPPDLHNEDGKKIVGIILICVSLCTLGLSAAVSIVYFAFCNRSSTRRHAVTSSSTTATANGTNHHSNGNVQSSSSLPGHHHHHHNYPNNKHLSKVAAMHGAKAGGGGKGGSKGTPPGSQTSLNRKQGGVSSSGVPTPPHSQSPSSSKKRGRRSMQKKAKQHQRLRNRSFLPTHTEEDPEAAKSVVDLKAHRGHSAENSSNSGSSIAPSQIGSTITDYSTTSFINTPGVKASPVIIIDGPTSPAVMQTKNDASIFYSGKPDSSSTSKDNISGNVLENENRIPGDSAVVYNENEIARTSDKIASSSSSPPSSSSTSSSPSPPSNAHAPAPYVSIINSNSNKVSYSNPAFQDDTSSVISTDNDSNTKPASQTVVTLDHSISESITDDSPTSTPPMSERFSHSSPLKQQQLPPQPSFSSSSAATATTPNSTNDATTTSFPQYPGPDIAGIKTYPTPLISAGLDLGDDLEQTQSEQTSLAGDQDPLAPSNHILQVKPHHQQTPSSSPSSSNPTPPTQSDAEKRADKDDVISDLPQSSRHHERYHTDNNSTSSGGTSFGSRSQYTVNISNNNIDNLENRSESRSSFNSSLSTDGEDRDDQERMQEKLKELLK